MKAILDNHGRPITYVRLAVTDRCNLRCFYCMPAEGISYIARKELLSYEELTLLLEVLAEMGISKVRITGGEPFLRKDLVAFLDVVSKIPGIEEIHITTNGVLTAQYIPDLLRLGIKSVNLSLDTLDRERFKTITRRDELPKVRACLDQLLEAGIATKINAVVMPGKNTEDLIPLAELTRNQPLAVRFIEEMPFNGGAQHYEQLEWDYKRILAHLKQRYPELAAIPADKHSTSTRYQVPGYLGDLGIIAAFTRNFCGTCNRIRLTPKGTLKTCLYDDGVLDLKALIRSGANKNELSRAFLKAFGSRAKDGYEAERRRKDTSSAHESMSTIGG